MKQNCHNKGGLGLPHKLALCIASALAMGVMSHPAIAAGCSYTTLAQFYCDDTTIYYTGNPLTGGSRDYTTFDEVLINTSQNGTTAPLQGWGVYIDSIGYKFKNLTINTTGESADGVHSKNAGGRLEAENITVKATGASADGINIGRELTAAYSIVEVSNNVAIDVENGMGLRANSSASNDNGQSSIIIHGDANIVTRGAGGVNTGYGIYAGKDPAHLLGTPRGTADVTIGGTATVATSGNNAYAVYAGRKGTINLNNVDLSTSGSGASAIYANSNSDPAVVNLGGNARIRVAQSSGNALYAYSSSSVIRSWDGVTNSRASGVYDIEGNLLASYGGVIDLQMENGSRLVGSAESSQTKPTASQHSTINMVMKGAQSLWEMTGSSVVSTLNLDQATLKFSDTGVLANDKNTFKELTVVGDYVGTGALMVMNTVLGDDSSLTDKLVVKGNTSGDTRISINNIGGAGDLTVDGIEIVTVDGNSDGVFTKEGRIVAGGYDYDVVKKANNWYLSSQLSPTDPDPAPTPGPEPTPDPDPAPGGKHQYRPEFGSYLANNYAANTLFLTRLHDRLGETQYTDWLTGEQKVTSLWMRNEGGHTRFADASSQLKTQANRYVLQMGGDLAQWSTDGLDRWHIGAMAGYANQKSQTRNAYNGYHSRGQISGYSAGLYATWYGNDADKRGAYVDAWALYNWFDNTVNGENLASEKYKSDGITASVESGYSFLLSEGEQVSYWLQPKAQLIWMDVTADTHREKNGARVRDETSGNLMGRLGVRAWLKGHSTADDSRQRDFQPFVEVNWIHNSQSQTVKMGNIRDEIRGTKNIGELKIGVEGQLNQRLQVWGNVAQQVGDNSYSDTSAMLGVKYSF
ncbi:autotransporter outer membrane beta-barrel domain-containing protein [[Enterobacter] lignolyticus]|uniref:Autotransporter n=1 Tax=[Enterobacter] lignolyticus TaxID=1334193 RepID=A0A806XJF1_9ENTR|nr:autotransporter outer membrane beta-barrel domain-containing protein [[Enterobacter] lignolyticus]ALR78811.1 autotransporter [[Enterobacter] lignolyticus]